MKPASAEMENDKTIKKVIEKMGKRFGFTHKIFETEDNVVIKFFDQNKPYGEVVLKKNKL